MKEVMRLLFSVSYTIFIAFFQEGNTSKNENGTASSYFSRANTVMMMIMIPLHLLLKKLCSLSPSQSSH